MDHAQTVKKWFLTDTIGGNHLEQSKGLMLSVPDVQLMVTEQNKHQPSLELLQDTTVHT